MNLHIANRVNLICLYPQGFLLLKPLQADSVPLSSSILKFICSKLLWVNMKCEYENVDAKMLMRKCNTCKYTKRLPNLGKTILCEWEKQTLRMKQTLKVELNFRACNANILCAFVVSNFHFCLSFLFIYPILMVFVGTLTQFRNDHHKSWDSLSHS